VPQFRIAEAAELLGVSDDTVRRWLDSGELPVEYDHSCRMVIDGATLAAYSHDYAHPAADPASGLAARPVIDSSGWSPTSLPAL
jgi:hypothetical protein